MTTSTFDRQRLSTLLTLLAATFASAASAQDGSWPQWRGPERTGISHETSWSSEGKSEPLWTKTLGLGHSSFAVADGQLYTLGFDPEAGLDSVFCLDVESGEEIWRHQYASEIWDVAHDGGALTTPTVVGDLLYTSNREGKVFCFERASGELRWSRDLRAEMELEPPTWGFSASPLVVDGLVFMNVDRVVALDAASGEEAWVSQEPYGTAYSTPAPFELNGRSYLAVLSGTGLRVLDREYGDELTFYPWSKEPDIFPMTPVVIGDRIFISAGYDRGAAMLRFENEQLTELWASRVMRNKMSGAVLWKDHLFGFDESILKCVDLDGKERWRKRGMGTGSMTIAGGRLVILTGRGEIVVAQADPEEYVELSRQTVLEGGTAWSTPVLCDGRVFCRSSLGQMACLDYRGSGASEASASAAQPVELPSAAAIVARHVQAMNGEVAGRRVTSVHMRGTSSSLINTVRTGEVELAWDAERGFTWSDSAGLEFGHDPQVGWMLQPDSRPRLMLGASLDALREAGDFQRLFVPAVGYTDMQTVELTLFEGRDCHVVRAKSREGHPRTLYFDLETGLLAGHQGEGSFLWTLDAYKDFDGILLPSLWTLYEPENGESASASFDRVSINPQPSPELFAVPELVQPLLRTPEQIAKDDQRLTELHAGILGDWRTESDLEGPPATFTVSGGYLVMEGVDQEPSPLGEPDRDGSMAMLSATYVTFTPEQNEAGEVVAIQIRINGDPRERLVR